MVAEDRHEPVVVAEEEPVPGAATSDDEASAQEEGDKSEAEEEEQAEPKQEDSGSMEEENDKLRKEKTSAGSADTGEESNQALDDEAALFNNKPKSWPEKGAISMARNPCKWFGVAWALTLVLSVIGIIVGDFVVDVDNAGWTSRGTLIANRETQVLLIKENRFGLSEPNNSALWDDLTSNVQPGWQSGDDDFDQPDDDDLRLRRLTTRREAVQPSTEHGTPRWNRKLQAAGGPANLVCPVDVDQQHERILQKGNATLAEAFPALEGCNAEYWYAPERLISYERLWPIWRPNDKGTSALEGKVIRDICLAEQNTQRVLKENGLCDICDDGECLPPYSLVFFARLTVGDSTFSLSCAELAAAWDSNYEALESELFACVEDIKASYDPDEPLPESCPRGFSPTLVDEQFSRSNPVVRYTSTIFLSTGDLDGLWENVDEYDRAENSDVVTGVYDTQYEAFVEYTADDALIQDMSLALGSAFVTGLAILVHTRSPWLTIIGLGQIIFSFPLAYFVYSLIAQLDFFPFLNFIGVFVVFALGADDVFVAVDKWKNARLEHRSATTEQVAAIALPDAAQSMFLTTITTAVAFFGTAICPVAPLKMFAVFNGLLITFDYFLCVFLIFPALCLYDKWLLKGDHNRCVSCHCCHRFETHGRDALDGDGAEEESESLIRRILTKFYNALHFGRWALLLVCVGAIVTCGVFASRVELPDSSDVRILDSKNEHEKCYEWRLNLLSEVLEKQSGSRAHVIWGVTPADTGNQNNPDEWSQLVLDDTFIPSSEAAQEFLLSFCPLFFSEEFAEPVDDDFECSINKFDAWLLEQSSALLPSEAYTSNCDGAAGVPVSQESFDACIIAWSQLDEVMDTWVLQRNGVVEVILFPYQSRVRYDSKYDDLDAEWHLVEDWMDGQRDKAPAGVKNMYSSSEDYWWYDTNGAMLQTAYGAAGIALAAAAIVMLVSSRSFEITFFALITIGFILLSVTTMLIASGWTLGFLESVCVAILIGISADFVIHFSHAYSSLPGDRSRHERSKYAVLRMGPSILAAAFTTICAAVVMIFTVITFFQKFAQILFYTVLMATIGSFVVFITLSDTFGPSRPTVLVDAIVDKVQTACCNKGMETEQQQMESERMDP